MKHRPDIDGLRAIAVLPVLFFHAHFPWFQGGFVGVDVFFVISGYLITSVIQDDIEKDRFSLANFYERRARRILPALFAIFFLCLLASWFILFPTELKQFGKNMVASCFFLSNFYFGLKIDYFAGGIEKNPLIHIWSLSVEEQFYLLYPLFLVWASRQAARARVLTFGLAIFLSILWMFHDTHHFSYMAFFSSPARAWELLLGGVTALMVSKDQNRFLSLIVKNALSMVGLALILLSVVYLDRGIPWPSFYTLLPTLGTALVLAFGQDTWVSKFLGWRCFVGIGLISYSLYLWHQPLFAFTEDYIQKQPTSAEYAALIAASLICAFLSWNFIEKPFRDRQKTSQKLVFRFSLAGLAFFSLFGLIFFLGNGFWGRFTKPVQRELMVAQDLSHFGPRLFNGQDFIPERDGFRMGPKDKTPIICLWGDSHAGAISLGLAKLLNEEGLPGIFFGRAACPPILDVVRKNFPLGDYDPVFNKKVFDFILADQKVKTVILAAQWSDSLEGDRLNNNGMPSQLEPMKSLKSEPERRQAIAELIKTTIQKLINARKKVILVYPIPEMGFDVPKANAKAIMDKITPVPVPDSFYLRRNAFILNLFNSLPECPYLKKIHTEDIFCEDGNCRSQEDGMTLYSDDNHLSQAGADLLVKTILKYI